MKKIVKYSLFTFFILFLGHCLHIYHCQEDLIFISSPLSKNYIFSMSQPFEERTFEVEPGTTLSGILFPTLPEERKGAVLCYHGRGVNLSCDWGKKAAEFTSLGYDFIIYDYRGFGKSSGSITLSNIYSDPIKLYELVAAEYGEENLIIYGSSLGTAFASYVGSQKKPKAIILDAPFYSMLDMACLKKPYIPRLLLAKILKYHLRSDQLLPKISSPILISHGTSDTEVPFCEGVRLYDTIKHRSNAVFVRIEGGGHDDLTKYRLYHESKNHFINRL